MARRLGWDVGGAHLKAALCEGDTILKVWQEPTPLWQGLHFLENSLDTILAKAGDVEGHAVTMTGELSDIFADRREGVARLTAILSGKLGAGTAFYAGAKGFVAAAAVAGHIADVASANWQASAALAASAIDEALFVDMGSTTTDIVPLKDKTVLAEGRSDAERMIAGELVYQGYTRTALMAVTERVPFAGRSTPIMAEFFATMADVQRLIGNLDEADDLHPAADGKEKTVEAARARLARMVGRDASDAPAADFDLLAAAFAEAQIRRVHDAAMQVLSRGTIGENAPLVIAGAGRPVLRRLAARLDRGVVDFADLLDCRYDIRDDVCRAAPAAAVALLSAKRTG